MNSFGYLIKQGLKNIIKNGVMSIACIGVLLSCLILMGITILLSLNINRVVEGIERQNEIVIFLKDDASEYDKDKITGFISSKDFIESLEYIDKDKALEKYISQMDSNPDLFSNLKEDNPLPDTYNIVLSDLSKINNFVDKIKSMDEVAKVNAPVEISNMLVSIKCSLNVAGIAIVCILLLVSLIIISNTVKLTIYSRRKEINIMRFVGATDYFIKFPFLIEGVSIGIISALIAYVILWVGYDYLISLMATVDLQWVKNLYSNIVSFSEYNLYILGGFLCVGILMGMLGSLIFIRKYVKV